ncbi:MAG: hypothetical protein FWG50_08550 [Kiritimatiellaeota bacterium]|nr:hypothetical protein [Kiritimatiellota bacterium]
MQMKGLLCGAVLVALGCAGAELPSGWPDRSAGADVWPGFVRPPAGYGEIPYWWWTGEDLDVGRLVAQVKELHRMGVSGVQVNYSHFDTSGWPTEQDEPKIFSEAWWRVFGAVAEACGERGMGIGLSTYTLDWPNGGDNLFLKLFYSNEAWNAVSLEGRKAADVKGGASYTAAAGGEGAFACAYVKRGAGLSAEGCVSLEAGVAWTAPAGNDYEVWAFRPSRRKGSFNPMMPGAGEIIVKGFYQAFEDHAPGRSPKGLNYFFNDELQVGAGRNAWCADFAEAFAKRKGYAVAGALPAVFGADMGDATMKAKMDYADVRMSLMEERYFEPIFEWHRSRGKIFACDPGSRGTDPGEFGDYFRATRWYTAPGHDTPGGNADLIKNKVSSSIANLYERPRVWLEGYHSLGWGAVPEVLMKVTRENYLYGASLLNLHGLYYSTYGSYWEWAPPCYHFRMPYWAHMRAFFDYFERLSYIASQGHLVADVAVIYPVAPFEAGLGAKEARDAAFNIARALFNAGIDFEFIDHQSLERAEVKGGHLHIAGPEASYKALVFPSMQAVRWSSLEKAAAFAKAGGLAYAVGALPEASDRAGANDPEIAKANAAAFPPERRMDSPAALRDAVKAAFAQDVRGLNCSPRALHRKAGPRDVYMVMDTRPGDVVEFRVKGAAAELWDPWTGKAAPLEIVKETEDGTQVRLTLEPYEMSVVAFTPGKAHVAPKADAAPPRARAVAGEWTVAFEPTMDNQYGDFRLPVTALNKTIGVEARRFQWSAGTLSGTKLHGHGTQFFVLGPLPPEAALPPDGVDVAHPFAFGGKEYAWRPYDFSWRMGLEGNSGHQGYHGLKRTVTDDFICLGKTAGGHNETRFVEEMTNGVYYLWTTLTAEKPVTASILYSKAPPEDKSHTSPILKLGGVYVGGKKINPDEPLPLKTGSTPLLIRYDSAGRGHFVVRDASVPLPKAREKLAMRWSNDNGIIPFDVFAGARPEETFTFTTAPGTKALLLDVVDGDVKPTINGKPMTRKGNAFEIAKPERDAATVTLTVKPRRAGVTGGALISEPILVLTDGTGVMPLGDWSKIGILNNYSGGVRYRTTFELGADDMKAPVSIDLGKVAGTAEVFVNGTSCGVRVAPPWRLNLTNIKAGANTLEVLVYNSLANHYQTIPSLYRGSPASGLLGPVRLLSSGWAGDAPEEAAAAERVIHGDIAYQQRQVRLSDVTLPLAPNPPFTAEGKKSHDGGGADFSALFNGTPANGDGGEETQNDGRTFVGFAEGDTLTLTFQAQGGVSVKALRTFAGHHDARASQNYDLFGATVAEPKRFMRLASVDFGATDGITEVIITQQDKKPLAENLRALRLDFLNGPNGFNVYRAVQVIPAD